MTSTLLAEADEVPQNMDGINGGSRRGQRRGCASWQMKRLLDLGLLLGLSYLSSNGCQPEWRLRGWLCGSRDRQRNSFGGWGFGHRQTLALGHCCAQTHHSINRIQVKYKFNRPFFPSTFSVRIRTNKWTVNVWKSWKSFEKYSTRFLQDSRGPRSCFLRHPCSILKDLVA